MTTFLISQICNAVEKKTFDYFTTELCNTVAYSTVTTVSYRYSRGGLVLSTYTPYVCGVKTLRINVAVLYADRRVRYTTSQESDFHRESLLPDLECTVWPINTLMTLKRQNITEKQNICLVDSKYKCMLCFAIMSCAVLCSSISELCRTAHTHRRAGLFI